MKSPISNRIVRQIGDLETAEAALEGDRTAVETVLEMLAAPSLRSALIARGATPSEAGDLIGDLAGDCFGGEKAKGGIHRLLQHYNGGCALSVYLKHVVLRRLISIKRKQAVHPLEHLDAGASRSGGWDHPSLRAATPGEDRGVVNLLADILRKTFASVEAETLLIFRLVHAHRVPQKRVAFMWGWTEATVSRRMNSLGMQLRGAIAQEIRKTDPWLELTWEDFAQLCRESVDLYGD